MTRLAIVGGAGTLGSDVVSSGMWENVAILDTMSTPAVDLDWIRAHGAAVTVADAADASQMDEWLESCRPSVVLYLATDLSGDPLQSFRANVLGPAVLVDALTRRGAEAHIINVQSFLTRDCTAPVSSSSSIHVSGRYAADKLLGEYVTARYDGPWSSVCLASVVSPRLSVGAIPAFARRLSSGQSVSVTRTVRDYLAPEDFIRALAAVIAGPECGSIFVGSGIGISTRRVLELCGEALGLELPAQVSELDPGLGDPDAVVFDATEFRIATGWIPRVDPEQAIRHCASAVANHQLQVRGHHQLEAK